MGDQMLKKSLVVLCALLAVSAVMPSAADADTCWNMAPFGNNIKLRFLPVGPAPNRQLITGVDYVFADRAIKGGASLGVNEPSTLRMNFDINAITSVGGTPLECNASVILGNGNGTYACWRDAFGDTISGDLVLIPGCVGVPGATAGADAAAR
jgi:hypothetical protein